MTFLCFQIVVFWLKNIYKVLGKIYKSYFLTANTSSPTNHMLMLHLGNVRLYSNNNMQFSSWNNMLDSCTDGHWIKSWVSICSLPATLNVTDCCYYCTWLGWPSKHHENQSICSKVGRWQHGDLTSLYLFLKKEKYANNHLYCITTNNMTHWVCVQTLFILKALNGIVRAS